MTWHAIEYHYPPKEKHTELSTLPVQKLFNAPPLSPTVSQIHTQSHTQTQTDTKTHTIQQFYNPSKIKNLKMYVVFPIIIARSQINAAL